MGVGNQGRKTVLCENDTPVSAPQKKERMNSSASQIMLVVTPSDSKTLLLIMVANKPQKLDLF